MHDHVKTSAIGNAPKRVVRGRTRTLLDKLNNTRAILEGCRPVKRSSASTRFLRSSHVNYGAYHAQLWMTRKCKPWCGLGDFPLSALEGCGGSRGCRLKNGSGQDRDEAETKTGVLGDERLAHIARGCQVPEDPAAHSRFMGTPRKGACAQIIRPASLHLAIPSHRAGCYAECAIRCSERTK